MNFCPACDFMVYTKKQKEVNKLINYCKNCEWSGEYQSSGDNSICVYRKNYSNDFLAQQAITSKYTVNDPTLPRISNIDCINENCLTNVSFHEDRSIHILQATALIEKLGKSGDLLEKFYTSKTITPEKYKNTVVNSNEIITEFDETVNVSIFSDFYGTPIDLSGNEIILNKYENPPYAEIIFIKYDPINLKYLYLCSTCKTTWKSE